MFSSPLSTMAASPATASNSTMTSIAAEADLRREARETYVEPLHRKGRSFSKEEMEDFKAFMTNFYRTIYKRRAECNALCEKYPDSIGKYHKELVTDSKEISYEDFWQRYFYRCDHDMIQKERNRQAVEETNDLENEIVQSLNNSVHEVTSGVTKLLKNAVNVVQEEFTKADNEVSKMTGPAKEAKIPEDTASKAAPAASEEEARQKIIAARKKLETKPPKKAPAPTVAALPPEEDKKNSNDTEAPLENPDVKKKSPPRKVSTRRVSEDSTHSIASEASSTIASAFSPGLSFKKTAATSEASLRRGRKSTYTEPLKDDKKKYTERELDDLNEFLIDYHQTIDARKQELSLIAHKYPRTVKRYYEELVRNGPLSSEEFWQRYFYRCDPDRIVKEWNRQQESHRENITSTLKTSMMDAKNVFKSAFFGSSPSKKQIVNTKQKQNADNDTAGTEGPEYEGDEPSV